MGCFMGGEGTVKIDWSRYNSILCKPGALGKVLTASLPIV